MKKLWTMILASALLAGTGCGGEDEEASAEQAQAETETEAPGDDTAAEEAPDPEPEAAAAPCPDGNQLTLRNLDESEHLSGRDASFAPATAFADPTGNVSATIVFTSFEQEADPRWGLSAPMGNFEDAPADGLLFSIRVDGNEGADLAPGEYSQDGTDRGRISFTSMYVGENRVMPGSHTVRITEVAADHICGEIVPVENTTTPSPQVAGRFRVDKV